MGFRTSGSEEKKPLLLDKWLKIFIVPCEASIEKLLASYLLSSITRCGRVGSGVRVRVWVRVRVRIVRREREREREREQV